MASSLEKANRVKELRSEMRDVDVQITALTVKRRGIHYAICALEWGFNIGDKIKHKQTGVTGVVYDYETYWPRIRKLKKDGSASENLTNAYNPEQWEKVE